MTYDWGCNKSNTAGAICGARTTDPSVTYELDHARSLVWFVLLDLQFSVKCFVDRCLSFCTFLLDIVLSVL